MKNHNRNHDRFNDCGYDVDDHPYDRGYWDRVLGHRNQCTDEEPGDMSEYHNGWMSAVRELRLESTNSS